MPTDAPDRSHRRDALRSREAIVSAAARLLAARGADVPLSAVGREAQVGQATLYRHFPHRPALLAAVLAAKMDDFREVAAAHEGSPGAVIALLRWMVASEASSTALLELIRLNGPQSPAVQGLLDTVQDVVAAPIQTAVRAGRLRPDFTPRDFLLVLGAVNGVLHAEMAQEERNAAAGRVLELVLGGVVRTAAPAPGAAVTP